MNQTEEPPLTEVLTWLLRQDVPTHRRLRRGLVLAYTPPNADGRTRLTLARDGTYPSANEAYIIKRDVIAALKATGRQWGDMTLECWLHKGRWRYHALEWVEYHQAGLFGEWLTGVNDEKIKRYA